MQFTPANVRRRLSDWVRHRRPRSVVGASAVLLVVVVAIANFAPRPDGTLAARAAEEVASDGVAPPLADSVPASSTEEPVLDQPASPLGDEEPLASASAAAAGDAVSPPPVRRVVPGHERVPKPAMVRGLYLNAWAAGSTRKLDRLIGVANRTEVNTFVIDVKEGGELSYRSAVPLVNAIGADRPHIRDIERVIAKLKQNGVYPIARIVVFKDEVAARAKPEWAIVKEDGSIWTDHHGGVWVDSYNREVWDYNIAIAREAVELGFAEVQWDYVRFPDVPRSYMRTAVWPARQGRSKEDAIREFLEYSREQLADLGVPVTADVFGLTVSAHDDMGIGQLWEKMVDATDVLLPMVYPSHFALGSYGIAYPNADPYNVIRTSLAHGLRRTRDVPGAATIRPWLQDFTLGPPRYGPEHVRAQIQAVYDVGLTEWVLWNPGSNYNLEALADAEGIVPALPVADTVRH